MLIDGGLVKNHAAIITALGWDKTMFSNVINGRRNVPNDTYRKFTEVYKDELKDVSDEGSTPKPGSPPAFVTVEMLQEMISNTTILVRAHDRLVGSHDTLVQQGADQTKIIDRLTAERQKESHSADPSIPGWFLEALYEVGTGKRWKTKSEAQAALKNMMLGTHQGNRRSIQKSVDR